MRCHQLVFATEGIDRQDLYKLKQMWHDKCVTGDIEVNGEGVKLLVESSPEQRARYKVWKKMEKAAEGKVE